MLLSEPSIRLITVALEGGKTFEEISSEYGIVPKLLKKEYVNGISNEIVTDYMNHIRLSLIAKKHHIDVTDVNNVLFVAGLKEHKSKYDNLEPAVVARIIKLYKAGNSATDVSKIVEIPMQGILVVLKKNHVPKHANNCRKYRTVDYDMIVKRYKKGATITEVADEFGISRQRVSQILQYMRVPTRGIRETIKRKNAKEFQKCSAKDTDVYSAYTKDCLSIEEISKKFGISKTIIRDFLIQKAEAEGMNFYELKRFQLPRKDVEKIIDLYVNQHISAIKITKIVHHRYDFVKWTLEHNGYKVKRGGLLQIRKKKFVLSEDIVNSIVKDYQENDYTIYDLAMKYRHSRDYLRNVLLSRGVKLATKYKKPNPITDEQRAKMIELHLNGCNPCEISRQIFINDKRIRLELEKLGYYHTQHKVK